VASASVAQRLEPAGSAPQPRVRPAVAGQFDQAAQLRPQRDDVLGEGGAPLEAQGHIGDPPAVVLLADAVGHRHPGPVQEDLAEVRLPVHGLHGPHLDAGLVHMEDEPGDAPVLGRVGVGPHQQFAVVGHVRPGAPDLLAAHDVLVALPHGPGGQRGQVGAGAGLGEALAPDAVAAENPRQVVTPLLLGALGHEGRAGVGVAHEDDADVGRTRGGVLLLEDQLLRDGQAAAAVLDRPVEAGVPGLVQPALPPGVVGPPGCPVPGRGWRAVGGHGAGEPVPHFLAEDLVGCGVRQVHTTQPAARSASRRAVTEARSILPDSVRGRSPTMCTSVGSS